MEVPPTRKVRPALALIANFVGLGLGYVYVGRLALGVATVVGTFGLVALFAWTRLLVSYATAVWLLSAIVLTLLGVSWIHPVVLAFRSRQQSTMWYNRWWFYVSWMVVIGACTSWPTFHRAQVFGYEPFRTPTTSMSPTIEQGDLFMVDTWHYRLHSPAIGEIVVFERPDLPGVKYVKRIVGLSGDQIEGREGILYRNGQTVSEPYTHELVPYHPYGRDFGPTDVGMGEMFVLGDYRDNSLDSREWGSLPIAQLHGRAQFIWLTAVGGSLHWNRVGISVTP
jgi:signal peptidase I